jgi:AGCS family alanine or glycine:cation symporter
VGVGKVALHYYHYPNIHYLNDMNEQIDTLLRPLAQFLKNFIFFEVSIGGIQFPLIVMWLAVAALFFTVYFGFINIRGFRHAFRLLRGDFSPVR